MNDLTVGAKVAVRRRDNDELKLNEWMVVSISKIDTWEKVVWFDWGCNSFCKRKIHAIDFSNVCQDLTIGHTYISKTTMRAQVHLFLCNDVCELVVSYLVADSVMSVLEGEFVDAQDSDGDWWGAQVVSVDTIGMRVHYLGWHRYFDEQIPFESGRIQLLGTYTKDVSGVNIM